MSRPCYDWTPLGLGGQDPVPGEPDVVDSSAALCRSTHQHLTSAATSLRRLSDDSESRATDALRARAREVAALLDLASGRYDVAAGALERYAPDLRRAQQMALEALHAASSAAPEQKRAARNAKDIWVAAKTNIDPQQRTDLIASFHRAQAQADQAQANVRAAQAKVHEAMALRDRAATTAANTIDASISSGALNDSFSDQLKEAYDGAIQIGRDFLEANPWIKAAIDAIGTVVTWVWDNIDTIALVLNILAVATAWIPGLNVVTGALALLGNIAKVISMIKLGVTMVNAVSHGLQTGDWSGAVIAGGMALLSFGAGKLIGKGLKATYKAGASSVARRTFMSMRNESVRRTGTMDDVFRSAFSSRNPPGPRVSDLAKSTDKLLETFEKGSLSQSLKDEALIMHLVDNKGTQSLVTGFVHDQVDRFAVDPASRVMEQGLLRATGHRVDQQTCEVGR